MPVIANGNINPNSILAPNVYVQIQPPDDIIAQGLPSNVINYVGVATYGPKNVPVQISDSNQYQQVFGPLTTSIYDLGKAIAASSQKYVNTFIVVRVTDGTDTAATVNLVDTAGTPVTGATLTSLYTGSYGNSLQAIISPGSNSSTAAPTFKLSISLPNQVPEIYDNIGGTAGTFWNNLVAAVNNGISGQNGPSLLVTATRTTSNATPAQNTYTFAGGTDGTLNSLASSVFIGVDTVPRTGMYALRNTGVGVMALLGISDPTTFAAQTTFGLSEGKYMMGCGPAGQTLSQANTVKQALSSPSYAFKYLVGDWEAWTDSNNVTSFLPPQVMACSELSSLLPSQSGLNQEIVNVAGTQSSIANRIYSQSDIASMMQNGIDVVAYPSPGGNYFSLQTGKNTSPNLLQSDDSYTRLTQWIAFSLNAVGGTFVGRMQTPDVRKEALNTLVAFLTNLEQQKMIGDVNGGKAFSVVLDSSNNPDNQVAMGVMQADVRIVTYKVIYVFLINLQNGDVSLSNVVANNAQNRRTLIR